MTKISSTDIGYQVILIFLLFSAFNFKTLNSNKDCPSVKINQTPKKFGIQTMTFMRSQQTTRSTQLINFLNYYANSQCTCFDTIYIVWNNRKSPQQLGIQMNQWKKKVVFTQTPYNSLGWKYVIPESAQEQFFFTVDDDILMTCKQLEQGFQQWKQHSFGQIGPLLSYIRRTIYYDEQNSIFKYSYSKKSNQYAISLMGSAFFSRQFADLYYSQYYQIRQIRKQVQLLNNCEDIAMNYVVSYFYPELLPRIYIDRNQSHKQYQPKQTFGVSNQLLHYPKRDLCLNIFSQILSFNPLRFIQLNTKNHKLQNDRTCIILQKINSFKKMVKRKTPQEIFQADIKFRQLVYKESYYQEYWEKVYMKHLIKQKQEKDQTTFFWIVISLVLTIIIINLTIIYFFYKKSQKEQYFQENEEQLQLKPNK